MKMKKNLKVLVFSILVLFLMTGTSMAIVLTDTSLQDFFDSQEWTIDAENDQITMPEGWMIAETSAQGSMSFFRETSEIAFGIYSIADGQLAEVFDFGDTPVAAAVIQINGDAVVLQTLDGGGSPFEFQTYSFTGEAFGFYIAQGFFGAYTKVLYSDPLLNSGEEVALLSYNPSPGQFLYAGDIDGDQNFSDIVAQGESIFPIPEPATMLLVGTGLIGLAGAGRKHQRIRNA
jgi:hypothetical protein